MIIFTFCLSIFLAVWSTRRIVSLYLCINVRVPSHLSLKMTRKNEKKTCLSNFSYFHKKSKEIIFKKGKEVWAPWFGNTLGKMKEVKIPFNTLFGACYCTNINEVDY